MPHLRLLATPANPSANLVGVRDAAVGGRVGAESMMRDVKSSGSSRASVLVVMKLVEAILLDEGGSELVTGAVW
jgi:hypothetical protein